MAPRFSLQPEPLFRHGAYVPGCSHACLILLFAAFLWGSGNLANKTILMDVGPATAVALRCSVAALVLLWPAAKSLARPMIQGWLRSVAPGCVMFALALTTQQWGYQTATVTNASFLVNATCVMTPLLGFLVWQDRLHGRTAVCAGLVLAGALLMSGAWWSLSAVNSGDVLCLVSAVFYSFWIILIGRHLERYPTPAATTLAQCLFVMLVATPFAIATEPLTPPAVWAALPEALYLGLFSTAAAFALTAWAQTRVSASTAAILISAESLFGAAAAIVFLAERPSPATLIGAGLILIMALRPEPVRPALQLKLAKPCLLAANWERICDEPA
jgi:drug/metabolite transporter (DMT)-like permease